MSREGRPWKEQGLCFSSRARGSGMLCVDLIKLPFTRLCGCWFVVHDAQEIALYIVSCPRALPSFW
jgi:hypothetical protein